MLIPYWGLNSSHSPELLGSQTDANSNLSDKSQLIYRATVIVEQTNKQTNKQNPGLEVKMVQIPNCQKKANYYRLTTEHGTWRGREDSTL